MASVVAERPRSMFIFSADRKHREGLLADADFHHPRIALSSLGASLDDFLERSALNNNLIRAHDCLVLKYPLTINRWL